MEKLYINKKNIWKKKKKGKKEVQLVWHKTFSKTKNQNMR